MVGKKRERFIGFLIFSVGVGILLSVIIPRMGWILFSSIFLICAGAFLLKKC